VSNLSALRSSISWGLRRLARLSVLFKRARYGFDMSIEIDHRIVHLAASRRSGFYRGGGRRLERCAYRTTPCESMKNVTRPSEIPIRPRPTLYAFRASPDWSLNMGYCLLFVVVRTTTLHECGGGVAKCTYGHIVFRGKVFDCWDGVGRDPDNRYASVLKLDFL
jgi:hypothetical protein